MSSTLREMQSFLVGTVSRGRFWLVFVSMVLMFAAIGPFGTFESLEFPNRLAYWTVTMVGSWFIAMLGIAVVVALSRDTWNTLTAVLVGAALSSFPIALYLQHVIPTMIDIPEGLSFAEQWVYSAPIALTFGMIMQFIATDKPEELAQTEGYTSTPMGNLEADNPLLNRLSVEKRGTIQHLSMQDHYVSVTTNNGTELILMRLSDAIAMLPDDLGIQIHRSHWVAHAAIAETMRVNGKPFVVSADGTELPISRSFVKAVKEAGML